MAFAAKAAFRLQRYISLQVSDCMCRDSVRSIDSHIRGSLAFGLPNSHLAPAFAFLEIKMFKINDLVVIVATKQKGKIMHVDLRSPCPYHVSVSGTTNLYKDGEIVYAMGKLGDST